MQILTIILHIQVILHGIFIQSQLISEKTATKLNREVSESSSFISYCLHYLASVKFGNNLTYKANYCLQKNNAAVFIIEKITDKVEGKVLREYELNSASFFYIIPHT